MQLPFELSWPTLLTWNFNIKFAIDFILIISLSQVSDTLKNAGNFVIVSAYNPYPTADKVKQRLQSFYLCDVTPQWTFTVILDTKSGERAFSVIGSKAWNLLPLSVRSLSTFKSKFKNPSLHDGISPIVCLTASLWWISLANDLIVCRWIWSTIDRHLSAYNSGAIKMHNIIIKYLCALTNVYIICGNEWLGTCALRMTQHFSRYAHNLQGAKLKISRGFRR